ncbi:MAG: hypothetical protein ACOX6T_04395 [Myxococcales bacterium]
MTTFDKIVRSIGEAEKTRRAELRHMYAREREREKSRRRRERQRERDERQRIQEEAGERADAEFAEWSEREEALAVLAVPEHAPSDAVDRLKGLTSPEEYEGTPFDERPFDYEVPRGPNAAIIVSARHRVNAEFEFPAFAEPEYIFALRALGVIGVIAGVIGAFNSAWVVAVPAFLVAAFWGLRELTLSDDKQQHERNRAAELELAHQRAASTARKEYEAAEFGRRAKHAANEQDAREQFDKEQAERVACARAALSGDADAMQSMLDAFLPLQDLPITTVLPIATVEDSKTVSLVLTAPPASELPTQKARRVKAGVTYRDKNATELAEQYRRVVPGLALRHITEVLALLPTVETVRLDVYEERTDAETGKDVLSCIIAAEAERSDVEDLNFESIEPEAAIEGLGGAVKWRKGQYVEQEGVSGLTADDVTACLEQHLKSLQDEVAEEMKDPKKRRDYELLDLLKLVGKKRKGEEFDDEEHSRFDELNGRYPGQVEGFEKLAEHFAEDSRANLTPEESELRDLLEWHCREGIGYIDSLKRVLELMLKHPRRGSQIWKALGGETVDGDAGPDDEVKTLRNLIKELMMGNGFVASWGDVDQATTARLPPDLRDSKWGSVMLKFMLKYPYWTERFVGEISGTWAPPPVQLTRPALAEASVRQAFPIGEETASVGTGFPPIAPSAESAFDEHPFDFDSPSGPNAHIVEAISREVMQQAGSPVEFADASAMNSARVAFVFIIALGGVVFLFHERPPVISAIGYLFVFGISVLWLFTEIMNPRKKALALKRTKLIDDLKREAIPRAKQLYEDAEMARRATVIGRAEGTK